MGMVLGKITKSDGQNATSLNHSKLICLTKGQIYHFNIRNKRMQVMVISGKAWITIQADLKDYLLGPGEKLVISNRGRMVIEGVPEVSLLLLLGDALT